MLLWSGLPHSTGNFFAYLHKELEDLKENAVHQPFQEKVVAWVDIAQSEMGREGQELTSLYSDFWTVMTELRGKLRTLRGDIDRQLG